MIAGFRSSLGLRKTSIRTSVSILDPTLDWEM